MPRFADRHQGRCRACREYARFTESLPARFTGGAPAFLAEVPDFSLDFGGFPVVKPGDAKKARSGRRSFLRPLPVAASLAVIFFGLVLYRVVSRERPLTLADHQAAVAQLKSVTAAPDEFPGVVARAESPLIQERLILEKSVLSAVEFLGTSLNIRIERKRDPKSI
jgi:hypothetical protein